MSDSKNVDLVQASGFYPILMVCCIAVLLSKIRCPHSCWQTFLQGSADIWRKHVKLTSNRYIRNAQLSAVYLYNDVAEHLQYTGWMQRRIRCFVEEILRLCSVSLYCRYQELVSSNQLICSLDVSNEEKYSMYPIRGLFPVSCLTPGLWVFSCGLFHHAIFVLATVCAAAYSVCPY